MDRSTYKAARRMIIAVKVGEILEGLYGLRVTANEDADFDYLMSDEDNVIDFEPEDDDED